MNLYLLTIDLYHFCLQFLKYLKESFLNNFISFFKKSNCFIIDNIELAALELVDRIMVEMDNNNTPISIFLDLFKAFDTINHKILLDKLK